MKKIIRIQEVAGTFAENKDVAKKIRIEEIMPALSKNKDITFDFENVQGATQSFIHALISDPIREFKEIAFDHLLYKNANEDIQEVISIVYRYLQESLSDEYHNE